MNKPLRLSNTQYEMYVKCAKQYYWRYIEGRKVPPSGAMKVGSAGDQTFDHNYKQKARTGVDLKLDEMTDFYATIWKEELEREEIHWEKGEDPTAMRDEGIAAVKEHHLIIAPHVMPISENAVQQWLEMIVRHKATGLEYGLMAKLDLTDDKGVIRDNKIVSVPGRRRLVPDLSVQLSTYALVKYFDGLQHGLPKEELPETYEVAFDAAIKSKPPKAESLVSVRTREHLSMHFESVKSVALGIAAGSFPMTDPSNWVCSPKWCGYWNICRGRVVKAIVDLGQQNLEEKLTESLTVVSDNKGASEEPNPHSAHVLGTSTGNAQQGNLL